MRRSRRWRRRRCAAGRGAFRRGRVRRRRGLRRPGDDVLAGVEGAAWERRILPAVVLNVFEHGHGVGAGGNGGAGHDLPGGVRRAAARPAARRRESSRRRGAMWAEASAARPAKPSRVERGKAGMSRSARMGWARMRPWAASRGRRSVRGPQRGASRRSRRRRGRLQGSSAGMRPCVDCRGSDSVRWQLSKRPVVGRSNRAE